MSCTKKQAIKNLSKGFVTQTHLEPIQGLSAHLLNDYLDSEYDLYSQIGQESLIAIFYKEAPPEARGKGTWVLWRICEENPNRLETYWRKSRALWQWRSDEASSSNHSAEFEPEEMWFAHLLLVAPKSETILSLWPLLEGLLPYVNRSEHRDMIWDSLEQYLANEVARDPTRTIKFYRLMHNRLEKLSWYHHDKEARKIIETAAANKEARIETLSLIDLIARFGDRQFSDIYERYI